MESGFELKRELFQSILIGLTTSLLYNADFTTGSGNRRSILRMSEGAVPGWDINRFADSIERQYMATVDLEQRVGHLRQINKDVDDELDRDTEALQMRLDWLSGKESGDGRMEAMIARIEQFLADRPESATNPESAAQRRERAQECIKRIRKIIQEKKEGNKSLYEEKRMSQLHKQYAKESLRKANET